MEFNKFDILSAYWLFGVLYHGGQWTKEYSYTSRAEKCGFKPGLSFGKRHLSENGKAIFDNLVGKEH